MKLIYTLIAVMALSLSALADEKPFWLIRYVSVVTDSGVKGYAPGTLITVENGKYIAGRDIVNIPADALTDNVEWAVAIAANDVAKQNALKKEKAAATPKVVAATPKPVMVADIPYKSPLESKGLGALTKTK